MVNVYRKPKLKTFHYVFIGRSRVKNIIHLQYHFLRWKQVLEDKS